MGPTTTEQIPEELTIIMEGCNGKLSKATVPKKSRPALDIPDIQLPFPPVITARDIFNKSLEKNQNKSSSNVSKGLDYAGKKAPNKFLIYRKIFVEELHRQNIHHSMTEISGFIARKWNKESKRVQAEYSRIATEVDNLRKQHFGTDSRKKSKKGQLRTFSAPVNNVNNTYPISNDIYGNVNVGNVANIPEQLDPNSCIYSYPPYSISNNINGINNISSINSINSIINSFPTSQHISPISPHMYTYTQDHQYLPQPQPQHLHYDSFKTEPNYILSDAY